MMRHLGALILQELRSLTKSFLTMKKGSGRHLHHKREWLRTNTTETWDTTTPRQKIFHILPPGPPELHEATTYRDYGDIP